MNCICELIGLALALFAWRAIVWRAWYQPVPMISRMLITYGSTLRMLAVRTSQSDFERSMPRNRRPVGGFWQFLADVAALPQMSRNSRLNWPSLGTFDWIERNTWK